MGDSMWESMLIGAAIGVGVVVVMMIIGFTRKPNFAVPPRRHDVVRSPLPPAEAYERIKGLANQGFRLHQEDPATGVVVLSDAMSLLSFGNFYPCFVREADGGSEIAVGIQPKVPQYGPVVGAKLRKVAAAVGTAVGAGVRAA